MYLFFLYLFPCLSTYLLFIYKLWQLRRWERDCRLADRHSTPDYRSLHTWGSSSQLSNWYQGFYLKQTAEKRNQPPIPVWRLILSTILEFTLRHKKKNYAEETYQNKYSSFLGNTKGKAIPLRDWRGPQGPRRLGLPEFLDNWHLKVVWLSAIRTGRIYPPGKIPGTDFCQRLSRPLGHSAAGKIKSIKNFNGSNRNRTHDLSVCSLVPQPTAPPNTPVLGKIPIENTLLQLTADKHAVLILKIITGYQRHAEYMHKLIFHTKHKMKSIKVSYALNMSVI